ncbi:MAG: hypothetical protein V2J24_09515, partial [Pseudomonadales bacterium]|nr:hypothetical protein [Pseudomonadales bacterium]
MSDAATVRARIEDRFPLRQKLAATAVHLLLSIACVGALLLLVTQRWYPEFLFATDGGWQGLRIVVLVDLVLGPLLTFVVYRRGKKGLGLDLSLIALLQLAALCGGGWVVYAERPLVLVFNEGRFYSVTADDYLDTGASVPDLAALPAHPPGYVVLVPPPDALEQSAVRTDYLRREQFLYSHVPWMRDAKPLLDRVLAEAVPIDALAKTEADAERLAAWLAASERAPTELAFLPYSSRFRRVFLALERDSGRIVDVVDVASGW